MRVLQAVIPLEESLECDIFFSSCSFSVSLTYRPEPQIRLIRYGGWPEIGWGHSRSLGLSGSLGKPVLIRTVPHWRYKRRKEIRGLDEKTRQAAPECWKGVRAAFWSLSPGCPWQ